MTLNIPKVTDCHIFSVIVFVQSGSLHEAVSAPLFLLLGTEVTGVHTGSHCVAKTSLDLTVFLSQPLESPETLTWSLLLGLRPIPKGNLCVSELYLTSPGAGFTKPAL